MRQLERISGDWLLALFPLLEGVAGAPAKRVVALPVEGATRAPVIEGGGR